MQIGELLMAGMTTRTRWMDRPADNAVITYEIINNNLATPLAFTVKLLQKNYEEMGNGVENTSGSWSPNDNTENFHVRTYSDLKEQVRFEISVGTGASVDGVLYRFLAPTAFNTPNP